ncbi:MAG: hypothetical protein Q4E34_03670 [Synergistaceae bacterium]|nr:hypothetical protein [Synergistaceae bacterium]
MTLFFSVFLRSPKGLRRNQWRCGLRPLEKKDLTTLDLSHTGHTLTGHRQAALTLRCASRRMMVWGYGFPQNDGKK